MAIRKQELPNRLPVGISHQKYGLAPVESVDAELEAKLERYLELKEKAAEFEKLKRELKPAFEGTDSIQIGRFVVTGKYVNQPEKTVPAFTYWDMRIKPAI